MTKIQWTRIKENALAALNFLVLALLAGTLFESKTQKCVEAYFEGPNQDESKNWIIILDGANVHDPRAKYSLHYGGENQLLSTKNALHTSVVSIKNGNGMVVDAGMEGTVEKAEKAEKAEPVAPATYKEILDRIRRENPEMTFAEAQQTASKEHKANQAA